MREMLEIAGLVVSSKGLAVDLAARFADWAKWVCMAMGPSRPGLRPCSKQGLCKKDAVIEALRMGSFDTVLSYLNIRAVSADIVLPAITGERNL